VYSRSSGAMWCMANDSDAVMRSTPVGFSAVALTVDFGVFQVGQNGLGAAKEFLAGFGQVEAAGVALDQPGAQALLQRRRCRLAAALDRPSASAARLRLPVSATCTNSSISVQRSTQMIPLFVCFSFAEKVIFVPAAFSSVRRNYIEAATP
jgi:hypothetical protein